MNVWRLILCEIGYRKFNFALSVLSVLVAVGCVVGAVSLLGRYDQRTELRAAAQEAQLRETMAAMEDEYRKITAGLGFNILVLPKDQNLSDLYADDFASKEMPEAFAEKLANAKLASINHLLPLLQQKLKWPERERTILLVGTRGEMATLAKEKKQPLLDIVPAGSVVLGYELHRSLKIAQGDRITLLGKEFTVAKLHPERGSKDDITLWINLAEAQDLLNKKARINAILALECVCAAGRLSRIRADIAEILPDTQVIEFGTQALARAEVRNRAATEATGAMRRERESRVLQRAERERLFAMLVPVVVIACGLWAGFLALANVRARVSEIGILRALGVARRRILALILGRAVLIGMSGAALGFLAGWLSAWAWDARIDSALGSQFDPRLCVAVVALTPFFSGVASWIPALLAAQQDPAEALRER